MATPLTRDALNEEVNTRFWANTGYKIGKPLDPANPADKAMTKVWLAILDQVQKEAQAETLVITHYQPEVIEALADAQVASDQAAEHLRAAASASDPSVANQHSTAAAAAIQIATQKAREARAGQPLRVPPEIMQQIAREATASPPPPSAPPADQIAHVQMQNAQNGRPSGQNGQNGQPSSQPSQDVLYREANNRFWAQTNYKPGQKLDMSDPQDRMMAEVWLVHFHDVEREAREGRLALTPGVPQDPYADVPPQGPPPQYAQDFSQPQYGGYGAPPGLTPPIQPQYAPEQPQYAQDFSQPQYGGYGAPPGLTPPQFGGPPQAPQYGGPQEMPVPQYGASQQITPPQYGMPEDLSQYGGAQQGFPSPPQPDLSQFGGAQEPDLSQFGGAQQGFPSQQQQPDLSQYGGAQQGFPSPPPSDLGMPPPPAAQQVPPTPPQPSAPQQQVPRGMEGFPPDIAQYMQQEAAAQQAPQQVPQQVPQPPPPGPRAAPQPAQPSRSIREAADRATQGASQAAAQAVTRASTALTPTPAPAPDAWSTGAKIGVAVAAFGGLLAVVYAATRGSHARIRVSSPREEYPFLPSRGRY